MMPRWWKKRRSTRLSQQSQLSENPSTMHHGL
jgi:hypothetical protein